MNAMCSVFAYIYELLILGQNTFSLVIILLKLEQKTKNWVWEINWHSKSNQKKECLVHLTFCPNNRCSEKNKSNWCNNMLTNPFELAHQSWKMHIHIRKRMHTQKMQVSMCVYVLRYDSLSDMLYCICESTLRNVIVRCNYVQMM